MEDWRGGRGPESCRHSVVTRPHSKRQRTGERWMNRSTVTALAVAASLPLGLLAANLGSAGPGAIAQAAPETSQAPDLLASPKAAEVVDAAEAFLATLSEQQRSIAQIELT